MNMTPKEYNRYVARLAKKSPLGKDLLNSFLIGGLICVVGPTRMDYAQITARLSYFAENLSRMFQKNQTPAIEGPENKHNDPEA